MVWLQGKSTESLIQSIQKKPQQSIATGAFENGHLIDDVIFFNLTIRAFFYSYENYSTLNVKLTGSSENTTVSGLIKPTIRIGFNLGDCLKMVYFSIDSFITGKETRRILVSVCGTAVSPYMTVPVVSCKLSANRTEQESCGGFTPEGTITVALQIPLAFFVISAGCKRASDPVMGSVPVD